MDIYNTIVLAVPGRVCIKDTDRNNIPVWTLNSSSSSSCSGSRHPRSKGSQTGSSARQLPRL